MMDTRQAVADETEGVLARYQIAGTGGAGMPFVLTDLYDRDRKVLCRGKWAECSAMLNGLIADAAIAAQQQRAA